MKIKKPLLIKLFVPLVLILILLVPGCDTFNRNIATPTYDVGATQTQNALRTEAAVTVAAAMTESVLEQTPSVVIITPSSTPEDTATASLTPTITDTLPPSETPTITATFTPDGSATLVIPSITTVPPAYQCNLIRTDPRYKTVMQRGQDFDVHWTLLNSGSEIWYYDTVTGAYRNGAVLHRYSDSFTLTAAVKPGQIMEVIIDMQAPSEPGMYTAIWVLKQNLEDFCWFSVDIQVE